MKRFLALAMSVVLAVGLVLASAFAAGELHARPLAAASGSVGAAGEDGVDSSPVTATFTDQKLFDAVVGQLGEQGVDCSSDAESKTVTIAADAAARVERLDLSYSEISDLAGIGSLAALPRFTWLDLSHNKLSGAAGGPLAALTTLTYLDLYRNALSDWTFLEDLTELEHLNISGGNLFRGDSRDSLKSLKKLK